MVRWLAAVCVLLGVGLLTVRASADDSSPPDFAPGDPITAALAYDALHPGRPLPQIFTDMPPALLDSKPAGPTTQPIFGDDLTDNDKIYQDQPLPSETEGVNAGGVHLDLDFSYANRYVYRGVDDDKVVPHGNSLNLLLDGKLSFDLGKYPHPFIGLFTNIYDSDPVSRFQEIRPFFGFEWNLRPFILEVGQTSYIYPERENLNTDEVYGKVTIDDSLIFHTEHPVFSPYFYGAYDYEQNNGWYLEAGLKHDFYIGQTGLVISAQTDVGFISEFRQQFVFTDLDHANGWQHVEAGLTGSYSLNELLNIPSRYGEFDLRGFIFYSHRLSPDVLADDVLWGGGGIAFKY